MIKGVVSLVQVCFVLVSLLIRLLWRGRGGNDDGSVDGSVVAFFHPYCNDGGGGERVLFGRVFRGGRRCDAPCRRASDPGVGYPC